MSPLELASLTKTLFGTPVAVVLSVVGGFPSQTAAEMRVLLLNSLVYPNLSQDETDKAIVAGGLTPLPVFAAISSQFKTSNGTNGKLIGQSFTIDSKGGALIKIVTNALGGVSGGQLTRGVGNTVIQIREYVNDVENGSENALTGKILAKKGAPTILNYDYGPYYPNVEFVFDGSLYLQPNTKYVMQFILGSGIAGYVKIPGPYSGGNGYDINGINLNFARDFPFTLYLS